jgi:predicted anti-sigma-YlaC factor YlaD
MNCGECQPLLSGYADDSAGAHDRARIAAHLHDCPPCRSLLQDLTAIRTAARSLEVLTPPAGVWHRLSAAAAVTPSRTSIQLGWFGWRPAAAMAMTAVIATGLWQVAGRLEPAGAPQVASQPPASEARMPVAIRAETEADYTVAIARLEEVAAADRGALDAETASSIDAGLVVIDQAITESRAALKSEPESAPAQESLFTALRRKVALLQDMLALINDMRKGNQDGAARILSEINR